MASLPAVASKRARSTAVGGVGAFSDRTKGAVPDSQAGFGVAVEFHIFIVEPERYPQASGEIGYDIVVARNRVIAPRTARSKGIVSDG
jgi:hypothetical protein